MSNDLSLNDLAPDIQKSIFDEWLSGVDLMMLAAAQTPSSVLESQAFFYLLMISIAQNVFNNDSSNNKIVHPELSTYLSSNTLFRAFIQSNYLDLTNNRQTIINDLYKQGYISGAALLSNLIILTGDVVSTKPSEIRSQDRNHDLSKILLGQKFPRKKNRPQKPNNDEKLLNQIFEDDSFDEKELTSLVKHLAQELSLVSHPRKLLALKAYSSEKLPRLIRALLKLDKIDKSEHATALLIINQLLPLLMYSDVSEFAKTIVDMSKNRDPGALNIRKSLAHIVVTLFFISHKNGIIQKNRPSLEATLFKKLEDAGSIDLMIDLIPALTPTTIQQWIQRLFELSFDEYNDKHIPQTIARLIAASHPNDQQTWTTQLFNNLENNQVLERWKAMCTIDELIAVLKLDDAQKLQWTQQIIRVTQDQRNAAQTSYQNYKDIDDAWYKAKLRHLVLYSLNRIFLTLGSHNLKKTQAQWILSLCGNSDFTSIEAKPMILMILSSYIMIFESNGIPLIEAGILLVRNIRAISDSFVWKKNSQATSVFVATLINKFAQNIYTAEQVFDWIQALHFQPNEMYQVVTAENFANFITHLDECNPNKATQLMYDLRDSALRDITDMENFPKTVALLFESEPEKTHQWLEYLFFTWLNTSSAAISTTHQLSHSPKSKKTILHKMLIVEASKYFMAEHLDIFVKILIPCLNNTNDNFRTNVFDILCAIMFYHPEQKDQISALESNRVEVLSLKKMGLMQHHLLKPKRVVDEDAEEEAREAVKPQVS